MPSTNIQSLNPNEYVYGLNLAITYATINYLGTNANI